MRSWWGHSVLTLCAVGLLAAAGAAPAAAAPADAGVAPGFFGVVPQAPVSARDLGRMEGVVGTMRVPIYWPACEPLPGEFDFDELDGIVGAAAEHGVRVQPFVYGTPAWLSPDPARPPLGSAAARTAWAGFLRTLVARYGPRGAFWAGRSGRLPPIEQWQIWNEPNFLLFWHPHPSPPAYARLLAISARAIRSRDRGARIVAAGLAPVGAGLMPWTFLYRLYEVPGVKRSFDQVALHPYASTIARMTEQVRVVRAVMRDADDAGTPLLISELGVASWSGVHSAFVRGPAGQARFLREALSLLVAQRRRWRIAGVDWFTWQDLPSSDPYCSFCQGAGLFDLEDRPKPAWTAFRRVVAASVR